MKRQATKYPGVTIYETEADTTFYIRYRQQRESFRRVVEAIHKEAGLPNDFRPLHGLRHNFGSAGAAAGIEPSHRKELLTHSTLEMTERYTHIADRGMQNAAEKTVQEILKKAFTNNE